MSVSALALSLLLCGAAHAETTPSAAATTTITATMVLRVDDKEAAADAVVAAARDAGGWFSSLSPDGVGIRVPAGDTDAVLEGLRGLGDLLDRSYDARDLGAQAADLQGRITARRAMLTRYEEALAKASPQSVVSVEREITRIVGEIEGLEGTLRLLQNDAAWSKVSVSFQYRERRAPVNDGSSSFGWINDLNISDLLDDLEVGRRTNASRATVPVPAGFALFPRQNRFQAVSPDDVALRVHSARNRPEADLAFWAEALRTRMLAAGYHLEAEAELSAGGVEGMLLELGAANGEQDQAYVLAIFVNGRHIVIAEATGEAQRFAARRDDVVAAIEGISF